MTTDDPYRAVMMADPPDAGTRLPDVWSRPGLSVHDRRLVTLPCLAAAVAVPELDAHIYGALKSGDLSIEQLNEFTLHFAVYCGWPRASQVEGSVRGQWQRVHDEAGVPTPAFPPLPLEDLGRADPAERIKHGIRAFEEINLVPAPPPDSPYFFSGILSFVFGHLWQRPGLTRRERRLITIPCVGVSDTMGPIWSHVTSALGTGDLTIDEMDEVIEHFRAYAGSPRADVLQGVADQWRAEHPG